MLMGMAYFAISRDVPLQIASAGQRACLRGRRLSNTEGIFVLGCLARNMIRRLLIAEFILRWKRSL
jgi:hypothetical protein